jgi:hypothetical protein
MPSLSALDPTSNPTQKINRNLRPFLSFLAGNHTLSPLLVKNDLGLLSIYSFALSLVREAHCRVLSAISDVVAFSRVRCENEHNDCQWNTKKEKRNKEKSERREGQQGKPHRPMETDNPE